MTTRRTHTGKARYYARQGKTEAEAIREGIASQLARQTQRKELERCAALGGWTESKSGFWQLHQGGVLVADVSKKLNRASFTAVVWHSDERVEHNSTTLEVDALQWCADRLRAAALNARVEAAMAGDADWNDGPMNPEHLVAGQ